MMVGRGFLEFKWGVKPGTVRNVGWRLMIGYVPLNMDADAWFRFWTIFHCEVMCIAQAMSQNMRKLGDKKKKKMLLQSDRKSLKSKGWKHWEHVWVCKRKNSGGGGSGISMFPGQHDSTSVVMGLPHLSAGSSNPTWSLPAWGTETRGSKWGNLELPWDKQYVRFRVHGEHHRYFKSDLKACSPSSVAIDFLFFKFFYPSWFKQFSCFRGSIIEYYQQTVGKQCKWNNKKNYFFF